MQGAHLKAAATGPKSLSRRSMMEMRSQALPMGVSMPRSSRSRSGSGLYAPCAQQVPEHFDF